MTTEMNWGIKLDTSKKILIKSRLTSRVLKLGMKSFSEYCGLLEKGDRNELKIFASLITTNVTNFFREPHHFMYMADIISERLKDDPSLENGMRIWSAGCSSGEEPYSILANLRMKFGSSILQKCDVLATDIDSEVLRVAQLGRYFLDDNAKLNSLQKENLFQNGKECSGYEIHNEYRDIVKFENMNLKESCLRMQKKDVIFCRNVTIYFSKSAQSSVYRELSGLLRVGGLLCVGHSERIRNFHEYGLESFGVTSYLKTTERSI